MSGELGVAHLRELQDHETPDDLQAAREEEGPAPRTEGVCVLLNALGEVGHHNLGDTTA